MPKLPSRLRRLDDALAALPGDEEPMLLTELDGFLAGVVICPDPILASEWLPCVWGEDAAAPFEDADEAQQFVAIVTAYHNEIVRNIGNGRYRPLLDVDERNGDVLWEPWIEGFAGAMTLRPESWAALGESGDGDAAAALSGMTMLIEIARDESDLSRELIDGLTDEAPELIPTWIELLHAWRVAQRGAAAAPAGRQAKVGRNEPCPCGSGKKWKRCCGTNGWSKPDTG